MGGKRKPDNQSAASRLRDQLKAKKKKKRLDGSSNTAIL